MVRWGFFYRPPVWSISWHAASATSWLMPRTKTERTGEACEGTGREHLDIEKTMKQLEDVLLAS